MSGTTRYLVTSNKGERLTWKHGLLVIEGKGVGVGWKVLVGDH